MDGIQPEITSRHDIRCDFLPSPAGGFRSFFFTSPDDVLFSILPPTKIGALGIEPKKMPLVLRVTCLPSAPVVVVMVLSNTSQVGLVPTNGSIVITQPEPDGSHRSVALGMMDVPYRRLPLNRLATTMRSPTSGRSMYQPSF